MVRALLFSTLMHGLIITALFLLPGKIPNQPPEEIAFEFAVLPGEPEVEAEASSADEGPSIEPLETEAPVEQAAPDQQVLDSDLIEVTELSEPPAITPPEVEAQPQPDVPELAEPIAPTLDQPAVSEPPPLTPPDISEPLQELAQLDEVLAPEAVPPAEVPQPPPPDLAVPPVPEPQALEPPPLEDLALIEPPPSGPPLDQVPIPPPTEEVQQIDAPAPDPLAQPLEKPERDVSLAEIPPPPPEPADERPEALETAQVEPAAQQAQAAEPQQQAVEAPVRQTLPAANDDGPVDLVQAIQTQVRRCWSGPQNAGAGVPSVTLRVSLNRNGSIANARVKPGQRGTNNSAFRSLARGAQAAFLRCGPYRLPADRYAVWRELEVEFYTN